MRRHLSLPKTIFMLLLLGLFFSPYAFAGSGAKEVQIPSIIIESLASGDLDGAVIAIGEEEPSPKLSYLRHQATMITDFQNDRKKGSTEKTAEHKLYQNVAIGYHNLYLFLKSHGIEQKNFLKEAHSYYSKARSSGTAFHKEECDVLDAALLASSGEVDKAKKKFSKIDETMMRGDAESMEYLASYYASVGDSEKAVEALEVAHNLNPSGISTWLAIGDDFNNIKESPEFQSLLVTWKAEEVTKNLELSVSKKSKKPQFEMTDETGLFRPQKAMPHYDLKKNKKKEKITKATASKGKEIKGSKKKADKSSKKAVVKKDTGKKKAAVTKATPKKKK